MMASAAGARYGVSADRARVLRTVLAFAIFAAVTRARKARRFPGSSEADRPARAAWSALRLLATSPFLFSGIVVGRFRFGADDGAQAIDADVGFAGLERRRWCRRRSS